MYTPTNGEKAMKVSDTLALVVLTTGVVIFAVSLYGSHVTNQRQTAAVKECLSNGGVPVIARPYTYCLDPKSMVGFPDVHPN